MAFAKFRKKLKKRKQLKSYIDSTVRKTGWSPKKARMELEKAKERLGVSYRTYDKYNFCFLSEEEQKKKLLKIQKKKAKKKRLLAKRQKHLQSVIEKTGWSEEEAIENIEKAKRQFGITYGQYDKYNFHKLSEAEQEAKALYLNQRKNNLKRSAAAFSEKEECSKKEARLQAMTSRKKCIRYTKRETGLSQSDAIALMEESVDRLEATYEQFRRFRLARIEPEEQQLEYDRRILGREHATEAVQQILEKAMERTGWTEEKLRAQIEKDKERYLCTLEEWSFFKFDELTEDEKASLFLYRQHNKICKRFPYGRKIKKILESKELTNLYFEDYIKRPWCTNTNITYEDFEKKFRESKGVVYKPVFGLQGRAVEAFYFDKQPLQEIYSTICSYPKGVVEALVTQHPALSRLNPSSVNTMRVVSVSSLTKPVTQDGKHADIAYAALKIGGGDSIADNLHTRGVCAAVDLETGTLITHGVDMSGEMHVQHPRTGVVIKGIQLPFVKEATSMILDAIEKLELEGVIGWDIAFGETGPVIIEPNARPSPILANGPYAPERKGLGPLFEKKYLWDYDE